jgi:hypothetical protein
MNNQGIVCRVSNAKARGAQAHFGQFEQKMTVAGKRNFTIGSVPDPQIK